MSLEQKPIIQRVHIPMIKTQIQYMDLEMEYIYFLQILILIELWLVIQRTI